MKAEEAHSTAECEDFVRALPGSGSATLLRTRVDDTHRRYEFLVKLLDAAREKWVPGRPWESQVGPRGRADTPTHTMSSGWTLPTV